MEKETGREYACKIMDINGDPSEIEGPAMREATLREIAILRRVAGHPYISKNFWEMWKWEITNKKII